MNERYGSYPVTYAEDEEQEIPAISVGDGSTLFVATRVDGDGFACMAICCGKGEGVGVSSEVALWTPVTKLAPEFILRFDNPASVDVAIEGLEQVKAELLK